MDTISFCFRNSSRRRFIPGGGDANSRSVLGCVVEYTKLKTGGNNPHISKSMRYAQYIRSRGVSHPYSR